MRKKDMVPQCVYAGPEMLERRRPVQPTAEKTDGEQTCSFCGTKTSLDSNYCPRCGRQLRPIQPKTSDNVEPVCKPVYAGPPIPPYGASMPGSAAPYPRNYQQQPEGPRTVYAGPPIDKK